MHTDSVVFHELLERSRQGDPVAFGQLLEPYRTTLLTAAERYLDPRIRRRESASDVIQDLCADLWRDFPQFRENTPEPFDAWVRRAFNHLLLNMHRDHKRGRRDVRTERPWEDVPGETLRAPQPSPSEPVRRAEDAARLERALAALPDELRLAFRLRHVDGMPMDEVVRVLDVSRRTVNRRIDEARRLLREQLGEGER
jgi:RNA polymerase sigma-70 factor (ECF subfamily)